SSFRATASTAVYPLSYTTLFRSFGGAVGGHITDNDVGSRRDLNLSEALALPNFGRLFGGFGRELAHDAIAPDPNLDGISLTADRSEEHTSELQSPDQLVCRFLLE